MVVRRELHTFEEASSFLWIPDNGFIRSREYGHHANDMLMLAARGINGESRSFRDAGPTAEEDEGSGDATTMAGLVECYF